MPAFLQSFIHVGSCTYRLLEHNSELAFIAERWNASIPSEGICKHFMRLRCSLTAAPPLSPLASFALNLKALTNRETFPTVNKHANKSTRDGLRFSVYIQSFTEDTYRRPTSLLLFLFLMPRTALNMYTIVFTVARLSRFITSFTDREFVSAPERWEIMINEKLTMLYTYIEGPLIFRLYRI